MKWISVKDRIPPLDIPILVYGIKEFENKMKIHIATMGMVSYYEDDIYILCDVEYWVRDGCDEITGVNFWMPLSSPLQAKLNPVDDKITRDILEQTYWKPQS